MEASTRTRQCTSFSAALKALSTCALGQPISLGFPPDELTLIGDDLDQDSNRVVDLINEGRLEEAEEAAKYLLEKYPEVADGLERTAAVLEAKGERERAAGYYRQAGEKYLEIDPEYGHEIAGFCFEKASELGGEAPAGG